MRKIKAIHIHCIKIEVTSVTMDHFERKQERKNLRKKGFFSTKHPPFYQRSDPDPVRPGPGSSQRKSETLDTIIA